MVTHDSYLVVEVECGKLETGLIHYAFIESYRVVRYGVFRLGFAAFDFYWNRGQF